MKKRIVDISPCELATLACSLSICLFQKLEIEDIRAVKQFLSALCSNLSLLETQYFISKKETNK